MHGGDQNDSLRGGAGNDVLTGGDGNDQLYGDSGVDRFMFDDAWGDDTIHDFANDGVEKINLAAVAGIDSLADLTIANVTGGAMITFGDDTIKVMGVTAAQLTATDFIL